MNIYQIISPSIGIDSLIVKANTHKQASQVSRDVIEERRLTDDESYTVYVTELIPPENDKAGYCYPKNSTKTFKYKQ